MKTCKKIISLILVSVMLFSLSACAENGKGNKTDEKLPGLLAIQPDYVGEPVTETNHEFKKSDFKVTAVFENYSEEVTGFTFELDRIAMGVYIIHFYYGGEENELYVPIEMNFFPTDREAYEG